MPPPPLRVFDDADLDPDLPLTPEDRFRLIASLLARGLRRLRERPDPAPLHATQNLGESASNRLAFEPEKSLTVTVR